MDSMFRYQLLMSFKMSSFFSLSIISHIFLGPWINLLLYIGTIKVGAHVIWCCGDTDSSNRDPIIQSKSYWDNRGFCRKLSWVRNVGSCNNCKWCFTFRISGNALTFLSGWGSMDVLPLVGESNRGTKKSFLFLTLSYNSRCEYSIVIIANLSVH